METSPKCENGFVPETSPFDPSCYAWSCYPGSSRTFFRRALDVENRWVRKWQSKQQQVIMYLFGELQLHDPVEKRRFVESVRRAWIDLRWEHPEVYLQPLFHKFQCSGASEEVPAISCRVPLDEEEANKWANVSLVLRFERSQGASTYDAAISRDAGLVELKKHVGEMSKDQSPPCVLRLVVRLSEEGMVENVRYTFCVNHFWTDGVGVYSMAGKYFSLLAEELSHPRKEKLDWTKCINNLPAPWISILNAGQKIEGPEFEENVNALREMIDGLSKAQWGLDIEETGELYELSSHHILLSEGETAAILRACKESLGISLTHLCHAAMIVATLKNPKEKSPTTRDSLMSVVMINGRRYLDPAYLKSKPYLPMCRAFSFIKFENLNEIFLTEEPKKAEVRSALEKACEHARASYQSLNDQASVLTENFAATQYMGTAMSAASSTKSGPILVNDGVSEQYIQQVYSDALRKKEVFSVLGVDFTSNGDSPAIVFRTSTFRGRLELSVEWNNVHHGREVIEGFIGDVHWLLQSVS